MGATVPMGAATRSSRRIDLAAQGSAAEPDVSAPEDREAATWPSIGIGAKDCSGSPGSSRSDLAATADLVRGKRFDHIGVELDPRVALQLAKSLGGAQRDGPIGTGRRHRLEGVGDVEHTSEERDLSPMRRSGYPEPLYHS